MKEKEYARLEPNQKVYNLIDMLDAKTNIRFYNTDEELLYEGKVYSLYDHITDFDEMVIDYMRFENLGKCIVCIIKPKKWN